MAPARERGDDLGVTDHDRDAAPLTDASLSGPPPALAALVAMFVASGAAGLVYEVAWSRRLELTFGSTTHSIGTVLAAYMAGLGLGAWLLGRLADRPGSPARRYAALEAGIGLYGLVAPWLLDLVDAAFVAIAQAGGSPSVFTRAALGLLVLLPPTILMGGTLPVLVRPLLRSRADAGRAVGLLYGVNTLGAVLGACVAGLVLVPSIGMDDASRATGLVNLALAGVALALGPRLVPEVVAPRAHRAGDDAGEEAATAAPSLAATVDEARSPLDLRVATGAAFGCGAVALALEVAWSRAFGLLFGSTGHGFTLVLAATLLGIGLGSLVTARRDGAARPTDGLVRALLLLAAATLAFVLVYDRLPGVVFRFAQGVRSYEAVMAALFVGSAALLLPATVAMGVAFPLCVALGTPAARVGGRTLGGLYLANTLGAILGSLAGGFFLLPLVGTEGVLRLGAGIAAAGAAAVTLDGARRGLLTPRRGALFAALGAAGVLLAGLLPRWTPELLDAAPLRPRYDLPRDADPGLVDGELRRVGRDLVYARDGLNAYVTVRAVGADRVLHISGKPDASTTGDMPTQLMCAVAPLLAIPAPGRVLVVGVGSGAAVRVFADAARQVDVVEIEPAVLEAASLHFAAVNHGALARENVRVLVEDARTVLLASPDEGEGYDIISSEPTNPLVSGVANLFTREHHERVRRRLRPGGVCLQWIQLSLTDDDVARSMIRTFLEVFPVVEAWAGCSPDLLLMGSEAPIAHEPDRARALVARLPALQRDLWPMLRARSPDDLWGRFLVGDAALRELIGPGETLHDRLPVLEGRAARAAFVGGDARQVLRALWTRALGAPPGPPLRAALDPVRLRLAQLRAFEPRRLPAAELQPIFASLDGPEAALRLALEHHQAGPARLAALETAGRSWPDDLELALERALALVGAGRPDEAAALLPMIDAAAAGQPLAALHLLRAQLALGAPTPEADRAAAEALAGLDAVLPRPEDLARFRPALLRVVVGCAARTRAGLDGLARRLARDPSEGDAADALALGLLLRGEHAECAALLAERRTRGSGWTRAQRLLDIELRAATRDAGLGAALDAYLEDFPSEAQNARLAALRD